LEIGAESAVCLACGADLPEGQQTCPACGWPYATEDNEPLLEKQASGDQDDSEPIDSPSAMDKLRSLKRPVFWFLLMPVFLGFVLLLLALLIWIASW
jgi:hypothetical protein